MTQVTLQSRKQRREDAKQLTVSTWHNGQFGVWKWSALTSQERKAHQEAQERNQYVQLFGVYA